MIIMALAAARISGDGNQLFNHVSEEPSKRMSLLNPNQYNTFKRIADYLAGNALVPNKQ